MAAPTGSRMVQMLARWSSASGMASWKSSCQHSWTAVGLAGLAGGGVRGRGAATKSGQSVLNRRARRERLGSGTPSSDGSRPKSARIRSGPQDGCSRLRASARCVTAGGKRESTPLGARPRRPSSSAPDAAGNVWCCPRPHVQRLTRGQFHVVGADSPRRSLSASTRRRRS